MTLVLFSQKEAKKSLTQASNTATLLSEKPLDLIAILVKFRSFAR